MVTTILIMAAAVLGFQVTARAAAKPNVLFIAIDDLRTDVGFLGVTHAKTPNLDAFASTGRPFANHYVQVPTCGASRCALIRGKYPDVAAHMGNDGIKQTSATWAKESLPGWFRSHGYQTFAMGKITHYPGGRTGNLWADGPEEISGVWDKCWIPQTPWGPAEHIMHGYANGVPRTPGKTPPWESIDGADEAYPDAHIAGEAVATLKQLKNSPSPWLLAVGLFKPHLPFAAPKKWYDMHDPAGIPAPAVSQKPDWVSTWHGSGEFRGNYGHAGRDPDKEPAYAALMRQGYAAAVSYVDAQFGRVIKALGDSGMAENTVVVVWSDHGFLLGEHAIWGKHCLFERALNSPMVIRMPGMRMPGQTSKAVVEAVDLFPTLTDVCGLPTPAGLNGRSLRPQLDDPSTASAKPAVSFWGTQRTVRTERWRLVVHPKLQGEPAVELFDYQNAPDEPRNLAAENPAVVKELLAKLNGVPVPNPPRADGATPKKKKK